MQPEFTWKWRHLEFAREQLLRVTLREIDRLAFAWPPQHGKTRCITVPYPAWRMLRTPGLRCGVGAHTQKYAEKISRWVRRLVVRAGGGFGSVNRVDEWELTNGSTFIARGVGASIAGEPLDLFMMDDVFGSREDADSPAVQENVYEWYMDDVTPRLQKEAALIFVNTRWGPADLIGRIQESEEWPEWVYWSLPAIAGENDPIGRQAGAALCEDRFPLEKLEQKRRIEGVGFESLYQQNPVPRGATFFQREWFAAPVPYVPEGKKIRRVRYWDLAATKKDTSAYTSGVLMAYDGSHYYVEHVVRFRETPAERNALIRKTADQDGHLPGFERTWFEAAPGLGIEVSQALIRSMSGLPVRADEIGQKSKEQRAEPFADAARGGLVKIVSGGWNNAYMAEVLRFPLGTFKDQVDSSAGAFNKLAGGGVYLVSVGG